jgi:hypothetical protein
LHLPTVAEIPEDRRILGDGEQQIANLDDLEMALSREQ